MRPPPAQLQLNDEILACASTTEVLDLIVSRLADANGNSELAPNGTNISTALSRIAALPGVAEAKQDARLAQVFAASLPHLAGMNERTLAGMLHAYSKLELQPSAEWVNRFFQLTLVRAFAVLPRTAC